MKKCTTADRLKQIMYDRGLKQVDILRLAQPHCEKHGIPLGKSSLNQYISGYAEPGQHKLLILGLALNVSEAWLMGYDVPMDRANAVESTEGIAEDPFTDELYKKISLLDDEDKGKVDGFVSGLLATNKYRGEEQTYQIKIAARGGGVKEITLTESQMAAILNAPEVTDLGPDKS